jgi:O-antigen/teichoic acid export membrane protein
MLASGLGLGANVVANLALIPLYGIEGAAIATPISSVVVLSAQRWYARRYVSWYFPYLTAVRTTLAGVAGAGAAHYAMGWSQGDAGKIVLAAGVGGVVYVVALAMLGERRSEPRNVPVTN